MTRARMAWIAPRNFVIRPDHSCHPPRSRAPTLWAWSRPTDRERSNEALSCLRCGSSFPACSLRRFFSEGDRLYCVRLHGSAAYLCKPVDRGFSSRLAVLQQVMLQLHTTNRPERSATRQSPDDAGEAERRFGHPPSQARARGSSCPRRPALPFAPRASTQRAFATEPEEIARKRLSVTA